MAAEWFCEINGKEHGPMTSGQLKKLAVQKKLKAGDLVWKDGMDERVKAAAVKGLIGAPPKQEDDLVEFEMVAEVVEEDEADLIEFEMVAEAVEDDEDDEPPKKKPAKKKKPTVEVLAEASVTYREGLPDIDGPLNTDLTLEAEGLRFTFDEEEFFVAFSKISAVREPAKGDFPPAMKKKAMAAKVGGMAGKLASGLMGRLIGGEDGEALQNAGGEAANALSSAGDLGRPPRNRLIVTATLRKEKVKILFDVNGDTREEMNEEAQALYKQIEKARKKIAEAEEVVEDAVEEVVEDVEEVVEDVEEVVEDVEEVEDEPATSAAKPYRIRSGGRFKGPYSLQEVRAMLGEGKIGGGDMIGFETWVPIATLSGLRGFGAPKAAGGDTSNKVTAEKPKPAEKPAPAAAPPKANEGDALAVDEEFQL